MACAICGKENPVGAEYCEDCGAALGAASPLAAVVGAEDAGQGGGTAPLTAQTAPLTAQTAAPPEEAAATPSDAAPVAEPPPAEADAAAPAPAPVVNPRLAVKRYGAVTGEEIPLHGERLVVGRFDPESGPVDIDLSNVPEAGQLSRHHAELYREADGRWYVKDLGSMNGIFVKRPESATFGPRLTAPTPLTPGDEVAFGNARFLFRAD